MGTPSIAALLLPLSDSDSAELLAALLPLDGYAPATPAPPMSQRSFPEEWLELHLLQGPAGIDGYPSCLIATAEVGRVFHLAVRLSKRRPELVFTAWRRFSGCEPVAKVFFEGRPQWREGDDPDHEVFFNVPTSRPAEVRLPSELRVLATATEIEAGCGTILTRLAKGDGQGAPSTWVHRRSPFARRA